MRTFFGLGLNVERKPKFNYCAVLSLKLLMSADKITHFFSFFFNNFFKVSVSGISFHYEHCLSKLAVLIHFKTLLRKITFITLPERENQQHTTNHLIKRLITKYK